MDDNGRGGYAGGRGSHHQGGYNRASSSLSESIPSGHGHGASRPPPEFEMKGNDFPALPGSVQGKNRKDSSSSCNTSGPPKPANEASDTTSG